MCRDKPAAWQRWVLLCMQFTVYAVLGAGMLIKPILICIELPSSAGLIESQPLIKGLPQHVLQKGRGQVPLCDV